MRTRAIGLVLLLALASAPIVGFVPAAAHAALAPTSSHPTPQPPSHTVPSLPGPAPRPSSGAQGRLVVSTTDAMSMPNDGLRVNMTPFASPPLSADSSFQSAVEEAIGGYDAVFGLFENAATAPIPFFSVFSNSTNANVHLAYWPNATPYPLTTYDFELTPSNGTVWELDVNHLLFGGNATLARFDFGATVSTWLPGLSFSEIALYPSVTSAPATFSIPIGFAVRHSGGWYLPTEAHATISSAGGPAWGIEGRIQHPTLPPGALVTGTSIAAVTNGTELWTGGPVPVRVALNVSAAERGLTTISAGVQVTSGSGAPIPGASVFLGDQSGGTFIPNTVVTDTSGRASAGFATPNVTVAGTDLVRAIVTTFGYSGSAETGISLAPAQQILIRVSPTLVSVAPGGAVSLTFTTSATGGATLANVYLTIAATAGRVSPVFGVTGNDGALSATLLAPNTSGFVTIHAAVGGDGVWGSASVNVTVRAPNPPLLSTLDVELLVLGGLGVLGLVGTLLLRRREAARAPLPPMRLPRAPTKPRAPAGATKVPEDAAAAPGPAPTHTPPEGGGP